MTGLSPAPIDALLQAQAENAASDVTGIVSGQLLAQGVAANVSGFVELARTTVSTSVSSVNFTAFDAATYKNYYFEFVGVVQSASNAFMLAELSVNGGASWITGGNYGGSFMETTGSTNQGDSFTGPVIRQDSAEVDGHIHLMGAGDAGRKTRMIYTAVKLVGLNTPFVVMGGIMRKVNAVDNALRFRPEAGNFDAGTFVMYGAK